MAANETTETTVRELATDELDATFGAWSVSFFGWKVTSSDISDAAGWVWDHVKP